MRTGYYPEDNALLTSVIILLGTLVPGTYMENKEKAMIKRGILGSIKEQDTPPPMDTKLWGHSS